MKHELSTINPTEKIPGFHGKFVHMEGFTLAFWEVKKGSRLPEHSHSNEQSSQVIDGEFELTINGKKEVFKSGEVATVPSNAVHSGRAITDCQIIDTFCPARPEYSNE
ncbi:MAG: cupin domain-containing protein [Bacteroidota bacterium]